MVSFVKRIKHIIQRHMQHIFT